MTYQHLSQTDRYQIFILMKDGNTQSHITTLLNRHKSPTSRELARNTGNRGYRPKQACLLTEERSLGSGNAAHITTDQSNQSVDCLLGQWSPVQIANQVGVLATRPSLTPCLRRYKAAGGSLFGSSRVAKRNARSAMPVAVIAEDESSAEGPLVSAPSTLRSPDPRSVTGKAIL